MRIRNDLATDASLTEPLTQFWFACGLRFDPSPPIERVLHSIQGCYVKPLLVMPRYCHDPGPGRQISPTLSCTDTDMCRLPTAPRLLYA